MRVLAAIGAIAIVFAAVTAGFFFGGFFDVSAADEDPALVNWALVRVREASIARNAKLAPPVTIDNPDTVKQGARQFAEHGCANCHGAPGVDWAKFSEGLNPGPPDLKDVAAEKSPAHLFWVIKNGIRMTGMPSFGKAGVSDDDIWRIVAFVQKLPNMSEENYKAWAAASAPEKSP